ncbi:MAG: hypothetical protein KDM64_18155, partial [Verrucomicrobiae bacterium]|nr:hypothetical protein [Verrucomicrobiae bacterium]
MRVPLGTVRGGVCGILLLAEKMKPSLLASVFWFWFGLGITVWAEQEYPKPGWPRPEMVGDWDTVSERFKKWEIAEFEYGGGVADGGSLIFEFKATDGSEFGVLVACSEWWTEEDWKKKQQPIFLLFEHKVYRVSKGGETERTLLQKLRQAASDLKGIGRRRPIYIGRLYDLVESRNLPEYDWPFGDLELDGKSGSWNTRVRNLRNNIWPFDRLDLEGATGDWNKILKSFKKWEIAKFSQWDTLGDSSTIFQFTTSDGSEFGILVPTIPPYYPNTTGDPFEKSEPVISPQVIFVHFNRRLYRIEKSGETEAILL